MPDVRAVQETIQFQAGSPATITVTAADTDGDPVDVTGLTFVVALRPTGTITATTSDPEAGTRVFSLTGANTTSIAAGGGLYSIADGDAEWIVGTARASTEGTKAQDHTLSVTVGAAQINVEVAAAIGGGGGGGLTIEEILEGVREDFQRSDVKLVTDDVYVMDDHDRIIVSTGSEITLPSSESMAGQEVTILAAAQDLTVLPADGESVLGLPSFLINPPGDGGPNSAKFVAIDASVFGVGWSWAQTLRQGPQWDLPPWDETTGQGRVLATGTDGSEPVWIPAGTTGQVFVWRPPGSGPGEDDPEPGWVDVSTLDVDAGNVDFTGTGLFAGTSDVDGGLQRAEGTLDRWIFVSAFATTNIDLSTLMGPAEVVTQPELDGGVAPIRGSDVWLFGQTDPAENGAYLVGFDDTDGVWTKYEHPAVFDPPGNSYRVTCTAPGESVDGVTFLYIDDDRQKTRRAAVNGVEGMPFSPSESGRWLRLPTPSDDVTTAPSGGAELSDSNPAALGTAAPGASDEAARSDHVHPLPTRATAVGQDEGSAVTATTPTSILDAPISITGAAGDVFQIHAGVKYLNNSGSAKTYTLGLYLGSTLVASIISPSYATTAVLRDAVITANLRVQGASDVNGTFEVTFPGNLLVHQGAASENIGSGVNLDLRGAVSSGGSQELTLQHISVVKVPAA